MTPKTREFLYGEYSDASYVVGFGGHDWMDCLARLQLNSADPSTAGACRLSICQENSWKIRYDFTSSGLIPGNLQ